MCDTLDIAKVRWPAHSLTSSLTKAPPASVSLTFSKEVSRRTVTLDGDSVDPSGTLTGGSKQQVGAVLAKLQVPACTPWSGVASPLLTAVWQELSAATAELHRREDAAASTRQQLAKLVRQGSPHSRGFPAPAHEVRGLQGGAGTEDAKLASALEVKEHELRLLEERASQSLHAMRATQVRLAPRASCPRQCLLAHGWGAAQVDSHKGELEEARAALEASRARFEEATAKRGPEAAGGGLCARRGR